ncbi:hypothetical protein BC941DRAFT_429736 [Chlamydoabsidia padenii]|nr:hypothetical protein BC941DRAFT_429736 [Chlamydoabsidia padenii]
MLFFLILSSLLFHHTIAIGPRVHQGCTTLGTNLYCYGGYQSALGGTFTNATADHLTVDMSSIEFTTSPSVNWTTLPSTNLLVPRAGMAITCLDNTRYVISGGGLLNTTLDTPTILYDNSQHNWSVLSSPPFYTGDGRIVSSDAKTAWAYGGKLNSTLQTAPSNVLKLDLTQMPGQWIPHLGGAGSPGSGRYGHAAVFNKGMIYYFGGFFPPATNGGKSIPVPMMNVSFYNTLSDQWGMIQSNGDTPTNRIYHTATLVNGSSTVVIYGGTGSDQLQALPLLDTCYTYNLSTHIYTKIDFDNGPTAGPLMGHSVVQYQQQLFILFGYTSSGYISSSVHILDVSDPTSPIWADQASSHASTSDQQDNHTGAIVGGVIGGVAFLAIVAGALFYWYRKKKPSIPENDFDLYQPPADFTSTATPPTLLSSSTETNSKYPGLDNNPFVISDATPVYQLHKPDNPRRGSLEHDGLLKIKPAALEQ